MKATIPRLTWVMGGNDRGKCEVSCPRRVGNQAWFGYPGDHRNAYSMNSLRWLRPENSGEMEGIHVALLNVTQGRKTCSRLLLPVSGVLLQSPSFAFVGEWHISESSTKRMGSFLVSLLSRTGYHSISKTRSDDEEMPYMTSLQKTLFFVPKLNRP